MLTMNDDCVSLLFEILPCSVAGFITHDQAERIAAAEDFSAELSALFPSYAETDTPIFIGHSFTLPHSKSIAHLVYTLRTHPLLQSDATHGTRTAEYEAIVLTDEQGKLTSIAHTPPRRTADGSVTLTLILGRIDSPMQFTAVREFGHTQPLLFALDLMGCTGDEECAPLYVSPLCLPSTYAKGVNG